MANDGADGDDQGSGWFEVKKRHRTSSKFLVHNGAGAPTEKTRNQNANARNMHRQQPSKDHRRMANPNISLKESGKDLACLEKAVLNHKNEQFGPVSGQTEVLNGQPDTASAFCKEPGKKDWACVEKTVVNHNNEQFGPEPGIGSCSKLSSTSIVAVNRDQIKTVEEAPHKDNLNTLESKVNDVYRIKWGNLDSDVIPPCKNLGNSIETVAKTIDVSGDSIRCFNVSNSSLEGNTSHSIENSSEKMIITNANGPKKIDDAAPLSASRKCCISDFEHVESISSKVPDGFDILPVESSYSFAIGKSVVMSEAITCIAGKTQEARPKEEAIISISGEIQEETPKEAIIVISEETQGGKHKEKAITTTFGETQEEKLKEEASTSIYGETQKEKPKASISSISGKSQEEKPKEEALTSISARIHKEENNNIHEDIAVDVTEKLEVSEDGVVDVKKLETMNPESVSDVFKLTQKDNNCNIREDASMEIPDVEVSKDSKQLASDVNEVEDASVCVENQRPKELLDTQMMDGLGDGEAGESKERFRQRLWCFLFENLNRAVDELYLLCELECDKEQMAEAILVLEEASSDFRELKSRVEVFESSKKIPSQSSSRGPPANVKADHRRPHALSWEVRRMSNSPQRAEILSSSLEAFKKIQEERARRPPTHDGKGIQSKDPNLLQVNKDPQRNYPEKSDTMPSAREVRLRKQSSVPSDYVQGSSVGEKRLSKSSHISLLPVKDGPLALDANKSKQESTGSVPEMEKLVPKRDKASIDNRVDKGSKPVDSLKRQVTDKEKEKEKKSPTPWKSMDAWKEQRNWQDILSSPMSSTARVSYSPGLGRRSADARAKVLHNKLMSPERKKRSALDMKREAEEKHTRAMRIRAELENERVQRLQRTSEKLNRVNEWQAVRSTKLREGMHARHQRSESRHEAYLAQVVRRAGDESSKVNEVRFITSLNEENKKLMLRQKLQDSEMRRAEKLQIIKTKQKEDMAREEAVLERRKLLEAEKLQRIAETQRKKEEAQVRREEERRATSAAREARTVEQLRRKEVRAKAQQEEAELLAQKLEERLRESELRRKFYFEQIRERASMDYRDQSPSLRRSSIKEGQSRSNGAGEDYPVNCVGSTLGFGNASQQQPLRRRIKKIRQRLMALKSEFVEPPVGVESGGIGSRAQAGSARAKIGRWLQDLQRLRQARKEGTASIGLIVGDMIKFLENKEPELHACRQSGLLDFIAAALPASHTSKPEAGQVTLYLLQLLKVVLSLSANRGYFLSQNLLPPIIPMLSTALENYIKITASSNSNGSMANSLGSKTSAENLDSVAVVLDGFLWSVTIIMEHAFSDENHLQMRDGLMELIISYQVVHRLRDLFSLFDRPQVEGSPFPYPILSSLNLLAILTTRSRTISSINWEAYSLKIITADQVHETNVAQSSEPNSGSSSSEMKSYVEDLPGYLPPTIVKEQPNECENLSPKNVTSLVEPAVKEDRFGEIPTDIQSNLQADVEVLPMASTVADVGDTTHNLVKEEYSGPNIPQKNEKNTVCFAGEPDDHSQQTNNNGQEASLKQPTEYLVSVFAETGLVSLLSLLTGVLLQANNKQSSEQAAYTLPLNFEETAIGVLRVLNNLALLDLPLLQKMLARPDLQMEFFHLMSFLLSHCASKWKGSTDEVGLLLLQTLSLLGYFAIFHPGNQAVLRWGKRPTILHKVCDLPFVFFSDPGLIPILGGTLVAACYGCEQNRGLIQLELSTDMLLSLLKSCKSYLSSLENATTDEPLVDNSNIAPAIEPKKISSDLPVKSSRHNPRNSRAMVGKSSVLGGTGKYGKVKSCTSHRDAKGMKVCEEWPPKRSLPVSEVSSSLMLHSRFPSSFLDRAEEFFASCEY
ncbi:hypothetical protein AMTRI_Chr10g225330 [Amborella trichopoda]